MDRRVRSMWWAHYVDILSYKGHSFWTNSDRMWKSKHKRFILMVIYPTCLRGYVPEVHAAILVIVNSLRRLEGRVLCVDEATRLGVEIGSRVIDKGSISSLSEELIRGLVMLEGSFPVAHLNPALHHLVHYGKQTERFGLLDWFAMFAFERNNKRIKGMVRHNHHVLSSLANNIQMDIATRFLSYTEDEGDDIRERPPICSFSDRGSKRYRLTKDERLDLAKLGVLNSDGMRIRSFTTARILGVHFKTGEWGERRCGSVVTTIYGRRSRYCVVQKFLRVGEKCFARVKWLSVPKYPYSPCRLVVRVRELQPGEPSILRIIIPIEKIDPCNVYVMPDEDGVHYYMMRDKGIDRVPIPLI